jgi:hypothetical protein
VAAPKPSAKAKPKPTVRYQVSALFGVVPAESGQATTPTAVPLRAYENMPLDEPLPDKSNIQLVYTGVTSTGSERAVFTLTGTPILHGNAVCLPSSTQCQALELKAGQVETLETVEPNGSPVTYELKLLSIVKAGGSASGPSAHGAALANPRSTSRAGWHRRDGRPVPTK